MEEKELSRLEQMGRPEVLALRPDSGVFEVDASAVIRADFHRLLHVSLDFDRYEQMQVPNLVRSCVISESPADGVRITWTRMKYGLLSSLQYLRVREYLDPGKHGFAGSEWTLFHPADPPSGLRDRPVFDQFDGSWYIEPLDPVPREGNRPIRLYIRYFVRGDFKWWVPAVIIRRISREGGTLEKDTIRLLEILACNAGPDAKPDPCVPE